jgi:hypothetical protein
MNLDQILAAIRDNYNSPDICFLVDRMAAGDYSARKQLADHISLLPAANSPLILAEIAKWGINDDLSACPEIRALA